MLLVFVFFVGINCVEAAINNKIGVVPLLLKYTFRTHYPISFKISKSGNIIAGDGHLLFVFDSNGNFKKKVTVPGTQYGPLLFSDFYIDDKNPNICYVSIDRHIVGFDMVNGKEKISLQGYGESVRVDNAGNFYSLYQTYDGKENSVKNKLRVIKRDGTSFDYSINADLLAESLEIVASRIMFYTWESRLFYSMPVVGKEYGKIEQHKLELPLGKPVRFIGIENNKYIFQYFDYKQKKDVLAFFDASFKFLYKQDVKLDEKDIAVGFKNQNTCDCSAQFPSGNIYSFGNNEVFVMRNTNKGTFIYPLKTLVKS